MGLTYQECLDGIFSSYMRVKSQVRGLYDRQFRNPEIVLNIARSLGVLPDPSRTIRVTGSKGKGSTSRMISTLLQSEVDGARVALLVSPEELEHVDRMRLNGQAISRDDFCRIYERLRSILLETERSFSGRDYFSPSGIFFLIALIWFAESKADFFVLEGGRGVAFDEVGRTPSRVAIVTSIFSEHLNCLGPTEADVAADKLSIGSNAELVVLGESAREWNQRLQLIPESSLLGVTSADSMIPLVPGWVNENATLARCAASAQLGRHAGCAATQSVDFPSFGNGVSRLGRFTYEALISRRSIDQAYYGRLSKNRESKLLVVLSLPDDKDLEGIDCFFRGDLGIPTVHLALTGTRGYLDYTRTFGLFEDRLLGAIGFQDVEGCYSLLEKALRRFPGSDLVFLGTQSYIRLIRQVLRT